MDYASLRSTVLDWLARQDISDTVFESFVTIVEQTISAELLSQMVGTTQRVVIDREEAEYYVGRTQYDSPEVDCEVLIEKRGDEEKGKLNIGEFYTVNIIKSEDFDLYASL